MKNLAPSTRTRYNAHNFNMRVLVIDDDKAVCQLLETSLQTESFAVDSVQDSTRGLYFALTNGYDLILLDNYMPGKGGRAVCEELRAAGKTVPILILSAIDNPMAKIDLLNAGADDYVAKPFSHGELLARMRALLRRPAAILQEILVIDTLSLNIRTRIVERHGKNIYLSRKEYALLEYMMRHQGMVLSRGMLMEHVWSMSVDPFSNTVDAHIASLRRKIEPSREKKLIQTIAGRGYILSAQKQAGALGKF